jgi:hypothetical protein
LDEGLIYKELQKLNTKRTRNLSNKWANELDRQISKDEMQVANKHLKMFNARPSQNDCHQESKQQRMLSRMLGEKETFPSGNVN